MTANTLEQRARELLAAEYDRYGLRGSYYITNPDMGELTGTEPDDPPISVVLSSIETALRLSAGADCPKRLIGWRTGDYLYETADRSLAMSLQGNYEVLPIFEGDPNTKLAAPRHEPDDALRGDKT
ncbi:hypothetical protein IP90_00992 [Luteimonas cucumeris]|uniref:Uncharacterized protein n=1 Tax=Luteimonas cucumeris TaxID=985012 RepID=A0A562LB03_9GAMM|nr:hypothetical protein [Luteimonas cucumeris]TWI04852.1 hypothetical protein IP90_00992 [Luteimonas cucumeris]